MTTSFAPKPIPKCPTCGLARGGFDEPLHARCRPLCVHIGPNDCPECNRGTGGA